MEKTVTVQRRFEKTQEKLYIETPFSVPDNVESIYFKVSYLRFVETEIDGFSFINEINTLDFSIVNSNGDHIGSAAAVREEITVSGTRSSDGFVTAPIRSGEWKLVTGTYLVAPQGVDVTYDITFRFKERKMLKGELHSHTVDSDGEYSRKTLVAVARELKLDFICLTDHHNFAGNSFKTEFDGLTVIPGMEWTNYCGHVGMLGCEAPLSGRFCTNTHEDALQKLREAHGAGAVVILNHPCSSGADLRWAIDTDCYDCIEVWNGPMGSDSEGAVNIWHGLLCSGKRVAASGGSDFHEPEGLRELAVPCIRVASMSREKEDILDSVKHGRLCMSRDTYGPFLDIDCMGKTFGEEVPAGTPVSFVFSKLKRGDVIELITDIGCETITCPTYEGRASVTITREYTGCMFVRAQVRREWINRGDKSIALLSNPVYFG